jgi:cobaltochelatase CobS
MASPFKTFPSRFDGKCASPTCERGGKVRRGQLIQWNPDVKGCVWHIECPVPDANQQAKAAADERTSRDQGPLHEAAAEAQEITPAVPVNRGDASNPLGAFAEALLPFLESKLQGLVNEAQVEAILNRALGGMVLTKVNRVELQDHQTGTIRDMGLQHELFPLLLGACNARTSDGFRLNIWLTGPAGSGKTTAAQRVAEALGIPFYFTGSIDTEYKLMGFIDAQGRIVNTQFRTAYEHGGVFLFDEVDSSLPGALLAFNAALANGHAAFPDGMVARHKDFVCIAAANTWGMGATSEYVGRLKLDAAFLDRFVQIAWTVDEGLELATAGNPAWVQRVQVLRTNAKVKGLKVIISPRASYYGAALLASGMAQSQVEILAVRKAMSDDQWRSIQDGAK